MAKHTRGQEWESHSPVHVNAVFEAALELREAELALWKAQREADRLSALVTQARSAMNDAIRKATEE